MVLVLCIVHAIRDSIRKDWSVQRIPTLSEIDQDVHTVRDQLLPVNLHHGSDRVDVWIDHHE